MGLNFYRDEVKSFMDKAGFINDSLEKLTGMLEEEFDSLKASKGDGNAFKHQIYDMLFLLFSLAARLDMDIDEEWVKGRERKKKYLPHSEKSSITYNKLIRDKIPEVCEKRGLVTETSVLTDEEYEECLAAKLREECDEYIASRNIEELADVLEVVQAIAKNMGSEFENIEKLRSKKKEERGGFDKRLFLMETRPKE